MSKCSKTRELVSELENLNQEINTVVQAKLEEKYPGYSNIEDGIELELMERYNVVDDNLVNEEDLDEILEKKYPKDPKSQIIVKIMSLLSGNPLLLERVNGMILDTYYLKKHRVVGPVPQAPTTTKGMLEKLDLGVLKHLLGGIVQIQRIMQGEKKDVFAKGLIGRFHIAFRTPEKLGKLEKSGAVSKFAASIYEYGRNISRRINSFYTTNPETQEMGIEDIIQKFSTLPVNFTQEDKMSINFGEDLISRRKIKFFTWLARGIIRKNTKSGEYEIASNYAPKVYIDDDGKRRVERYESTGDIMHQLQDYIPLSEYEDGYLDIPFTKDALIEIDELIAKYREINERVRLAIAEEFTKSVKMVYNSMLKAFPELADVNVDIAVGEEVETKALINALLFAKSDELLSQAIKVAEGVLSPEKFKLLQKLRKVYAGFIKDDRYFALFDNVNEKLENREEMRKKLGDKVETYFPVKYPEYHVLREFEMIRDRLERELSMIDETKEPEKFESLERRLAYVTGVIEDFHDSPIAEDSGEKMVFQSRSRNYISYTGAMDIRNMKTDSGVYHDYLKYNFSQIERNRLTAKLIDSIIMTDNESTQDYLLDLYQVPFNGKNIKTRLGLFNIDPNRLSEKGKDRLDRWTQRISAGLTFGYLGGIMTGAVNSSAVWQNIYKNSLTETLEMMRLYNNLNDVENVALNNIIQRSGITDMSNFFGEALVENIAETRLERLFKYEDSIEEG